MDKHYLTPLFSPESIVVLAGRTDDPSSQTRHGRVLCDALRAQPYGGQLHFVDTSTSGTLADLAQTRADLALIALPPAEVAAALEVAGRMSCRAALVVSSGIGAELAADLKRIARREGVYLLGPNSLGLQRPALHLNASAAGPLAMPGSLALVSQSGALTSSILDWASNNAVGFSTVVSLGPNTAVDIAQVLDFLANDGSTHSIVVYLEGISSARSFMSALRSAANAKPVVVLKAGPQAGRQPGGADAQRRHRRQRRCVRRRAAARRRGARALLRRAVLGRQVPGLALPPGGPAPGHRHQRRRTRRAGGRLGQRNRPRPGPAVAASRRAALTPQLPALASLSDLIDLSEDATPEHYQRRHRSRQRRDRRSTACW